MKNDKSKRVDGVYVCGVGLKWKFWEKYCQENFFRVKSANGQSQDNENKHDVKVDYKIIIECGK